MHGHNSVDTLTQTKIFGTIIKYSSSAVRNSPYFWSYDEFRWCHGLPTQRRLFTLDEVPRKTLRAKNAPTWVSTGHWVCNRSPSSSAFCPELRVSFFNIPKGVFYHSSTMMHSLLLLANQRIFVLPAACGLVAIDLGRRVVLH